MQTSGTIFDIKRYSINDGPGIRLTVFLKGCPLQCVWCHNPEGIKPQAQKMYNKNKCIGCSSCVEICPENACKLTPEGIVTDTRLCTVCGKCADICPTRAMEVSGRVVTLEEIVEEVEKERVFFDQSGGGVTFSGGEPLTQPKFLLALLKEMGKRSIHRVVDTTGFAKTETLLEVSKNTDHFLYDLKMMNSKRHKKWTGVPNEQIQKNLKILADTGKKINIRIPLIKGVNADQENIEQTIAFVSTLGGPPKKVDLLPYHNIAEGKYSRLGKIFNDHGITEPSTEEVECIVEKFQAAGIEAGVGG